MNTPTLNGYLVMAFAILQSAQGTAKNYLPVLKVDMQQADADTLKQYLLAIRRKDPCDKLRFYHSLWPTQFLTSANEACKFALLFWQNLPSAAEISCGHADSAVCRPIRDSRRCTAFARKECSFVCDSVSAGRIVKYLSELIKPPNNPNAVEMYKIGDIMSGV